MTTLNQVTPITLSSLPDATMLTGDEPTVLVQGGATVQAPVSQLPQGMTAGVVVYGNTGGSPFPNFRTLKAGTHIAISDAGAQGDLTIGVTTGIGAGSVTDVSVVTANGISGSVANSTTTPAITLTLGAITPSSVNGITFSVTGTPSVIIGSGGTVAYLDVSQAFTKQQTLTPQILTSTSNSIAWNATNGNNAFHAATENTTLANPTNIVSGTVYTFQWTQNASASKTLAFGNKWKFYGASTVSTTLSAVNIITGLYDGTNVNSVMTGPFV